MGLAWNQWGRYQLPSVYKVGPVEMTCTFSRVYLVHSYHGKLPKSWAFYLPSTHAYPEGLPQVKQYPEVKSTKAMDNCNSKGEGLVREFPSVFSGQISAMEGELFKISLMENAQPFSVKAPRAVPFAYREKLQQELDSLQQQDIIAPVAQPTEWCAPIVVAPKKGTDDIRLCVDLSKTQ